MGIAAIREVNIPCNRFMAQRTRLSRCTDSRIVSPFVIARSIESRPARGGRPANPRYPSASLRTASSEGAFCIIPVQALLNEQCLSVARQTERVLPPIDHLVYWVCKGNNNHRHRPLHGARGRGRDEGLF